ncbi:hypothetical protein PF005_g2276 [Phytophthora fragariae]|uniref:Uncharacterized protein n=1 Tax=Phytophthora fragariae TaxID=53985 RepID=A0A6A3MD19_9STRA|nr:hypothetical protein PF003_g18726 [Phytophthora fragariae]KAE8948008.1 hypothetical protein PF009_g2407 [Phytophthora fragariae]KAE9027445.1 hypothetical protein PF011_g2051 [Phytophthora fragariae]KAE9121639.1 hypothetical protein PF010_g7021 [Phytophthora fragariae]KAE9136512.1 hypothetical protein PF007_g2178 [Phytophthora fragariae]
MHKSGNRTYRTLAACLSVLSFRARSCTSSSKSSYGVLPHSQVQSVTCTTDKRHVDLIDEPLVESTVVID